MPNATTVVNSDFVDNIKDVELKNNCQKAIIVLAYFNEALNHYATCTNSTMNQILDVVKGMLYGHSPTLVGKITFELDKKEVLKRYIKYANEEVSSLSFKVFVEINDDKFCMQLNYDNESDKPFDAKIMIF